jgi:hypothetical protein
MVVVAVVGLLFGAVDWLSLSLRASKYRRKAEAAARMERRLREIDAMDPVSRARAAKEAEENFQEVTHSWLANPVWTRKLIGYFAAMRTKYEHAAENPRLSVPPDPPQP